MIAELLELPIIINTPNFFHIRLIINHRGKYWTKKNNIINMYFQLNICNVYDLDEKSQSLNIRNAQNIDWLVSLLCIFINNIWNL